MIFAFKTVSSIAIPSPYRKRRSFLAERRLEKRSKSAFVALDGCSNVSETSDHNHFWNMLISPANQLTLVPFCDGTSRSYLMIGSIFVYLYIYICILDICLAIYSAEISALCSITFQYISWFSCTNVPYLVKNAGCSSSRAEITGGWPGVSRWNLHGEGAMFPCCVWFFHCLVLLIIFQPISYLLAKHEANSNDFDG